jgi:hypothetical protein
MGGRRLVQVWRVRNWDQGVYSIARVAFRPEGGATCVVLDRASFPEEQQPHLEPGWHQNDWRPLQQILV